MTAKKTKQNILNLHDGFIKRLLMTDLVCVKQYFGMN